jgi:hypothetical protein
MQQSNSQEIKCKAVAGARRNEQHTQQAEGTGEPVQVGR